MFPFPLTFISVIWSWFAHPFALLIIYQLKGDCDIFCFNICNLFYFTFFSLVMQQPNFNIIYHMWYIQGTNGGAVEWTDLLRCVWSLLNWLWFWRSNSVRHCVCRVRNTSIKTSSRIAGPEKRQTDWLTEVCDNIWTVRQHDIYPHLQHATYPKLWAVTDYQALVYPADL